jgi:hypothetical protein
VENNLILNTKIEILFYSIGELHQPEPMPPYEDQEFDDSYQAIGYASLFILNQDTSCGKCRDDDDYDEYIHPNCYCDEISPNNRNESDYITWCVCVMALLKNPGPIESSKVIFHIWEGDHSKVTTIRSEVDEIVAPIQFSHGMYPVVPHHTVVLEPSGFTGGDHEILSKVPSNFEVTGGGHTGLKTSVSNYIKRGIKMLESAQNRSTEPTLANDPVCAHTQKKGNKRGLRRN